PAKFRLVEPQRCHHGAARPMLIVPREPKIAVQVTGELGALAPCRIVVAGANRARAIGHFADATEVIAGVIEVQPAALLALGEVAADHSVAGIALLGDRVAFPD